MKRIYTAFAFAGIVMAFAACDKDFEAINTNPVQSTSLDPGYLFFNAQVLSAVSTLPYQMQIVQQLNTPFTGVLEGGNHNIAYEPNANAIFNAMYTGTAVGGPVRFLTDVINQTKDNPARSNLYNMARIWKAYVFQILVDTYGDVPYFEAGKAYSDGINLPKYDDQKLIYDDLLKELSEAPKALDAAKAIEGGDLFYQGNIEQWKKLGNSLLLRVAMRYTKLDENKAKQYVLAAVDPAAGGLISSNDDNAFLQYNANYSNPETNSFLGTERQNYYLAKPFVDYLKATADPRLSVIAVKYGNPDQGLEPDATPAIQEGMPFGYNETTIVDAPGYPGKINAAYKYSQLNRSTVARADAPYFFITYAQTQLLFGEAALRGYITGDPAANYVNAVRGHMDQLKTYDVTATIPVAAQDAYLAANPYDPTKGLEQLNTQYWIASFLNGAEAWANFRRSGYPQLQPNPYPSPDPSVQNGFIRRLIYPAREQSVNAANYREAVDRMGPDNLATRIFWDTP